MATTPPTTPANSTPPASVPAPKLNWWQKLFKGIGRAFTLPGADRKVIDANPLTPVAQGILASELSTAIQNSTAHITDPVQQAAVQNLLAAGIHSTGILN